MFPSDSNSGPPYPHDPAPYRGRIAPSPTGYLHLGHARTFWIAQDRARAGNGILILRNEDLDTSRVRPEFVSAMFEDLRWFGLDWDEGPDRGGPCQPYNQSERLHLYREAFNRLREQRLIYPCTCSRKDVQLAAGAPHPGEDELHYPGTCRSNPPSALNRAHRPHCWRFRIQHHEPIMFMDHARGIQRFEAGIDFGDFVIWRQDELPSYQLAVVVDDAMMGMTEVVRGEDLLRSTARQILLYRALGWKIPSFYHCPLMTDASGVRLAKRHDALSLRQLRATGQTPEHLRALCFPDR